MFVAWLGLPLLIAGEPDALLETVRFSYVAAASAVPFVLFIGVPEALALAHYDRLRWWPLALVGFVAACLPMALSVTGNAPGFSSSGHWHGKSVDFVVNGQMTLFGWLSTLEPIFGRATWSRRCRGVLLSVAAEHGQAGRVRPSPGVIAARASSAHASTKALAMQTKQRRPVSGPASCFFS